VDLGATSIAFDTSSSIAGASVLTQVEWLRRSLYAVVNGNLTAFEGSSWTVQGWGDVSFLTDPLALDGRLRIEAAGSLNASRHADGYQTGSSRVEVRAHIAGATQGAWLGYAAGTGWTSDAIRVGTSVGPTVGAWFDRLALTGTVTWTPLRFAGYGFHEFNGRAVMRRGRVDVTAYGGWRTAPVASGLEKEGWGGAAVAVWVAPRAAVIASAGSYASDLLQVLPRGRYTSIGLRLAAGRPPVWTPALTGRAVHALSGEGGTGEIRVRVPGATRVDVAGDWTVWRPIPLEQGLDGRWILRLQLEAGIYRFNLIVDGKRWIVPAGFATVDDGFGGKAGVLVIP
jgi:hypothetical protein